MKKITLVIEYSNFFDKDITNFLSSLDGVLNSNINTKNNEIYVEYDSSLISLKLLKMNILLYLNLINIPSIVSFNKHDNKNIKNKTITIEDLCCEFCLKCMIEELLEIDGIVSAYTDFDYINKVNVNIFITYNDKLIDDYKLKEIKNKFNHYY